MCYFTPYHLVQTSSSSTRIVTWLIQRETYTVLLGNIFTLFWVIPLIPFHNINDPLFGGFRKGASAARLKTVNISNAAISLRAWLWRRIMTCDQLHSWKCALFVSSQNPSSIRPIKKDTLYILLFKKCLRYDRVSTIDD